MQSHIKVLEKAHRSAGLVFYPLKRVVSSPFHLCENPLERKKPLFICLGTASHPQFSCRKLSKLHIFLVLHSQQRQKGSSCESQTSPAIKYI